MNALALWLHSGKHKWAQMCLQYPNKNTTVYFANSCPLWNLSLGISHKIKWKIIRILPKHMYREKKRMTNSISSSQCLAHRVNLTISDGTCSVVNSTTDTQFASTVTTNSVARVFRLHMQTYSFQENLLCSKRYSYKKHGNLTPLGKSSHRSNRNSSRKALLDN